MSHKKHRNVAVKQRAYRDRLRKKAAAAYWVEMTPYKEMQLAMFTEGHNIGYHKRKPHSLCPLCNTVTGVWFRVTVREQANG